MLTVTIKNITEDTSEKIHDYHYSVMVNFKEISSGTVFNKREDGWVSLLERIVIEERVKVSLKDAKNSVGFGWHGLLEEIYAKLPTNASVSTVKEKFGTLRVYIDNIDRNLLEEIDKICAHSSLICESCGKPATTKSTNGWLVTLCQDCYVIRYPQPQDINTT